MSDSLWPHVLYSPCHSPGQNTGVGSHSLLQGIFPTQVSNPGLLHCRQIVHQQSHQGSPRILEWVAYPFSSRSSWPRNWTGVFCIAGRFFTSWATREALRLVCNWIQSDPWTTWVWTVQAHLHKFFSVVNKYYSATLSCLVEFMDEEPQTWTNCWYRSLTKLYSDIWWPPPTPSWSKVNRMIFLNSLTEI